MLTGRNASQYHPMVILLYVTQCVGFESIRNMAHTLVGLSYRLQCEDVFRVGAIEMIMFSEKLKGIGHGYHGTCGLFTIVCFQPL